MNIFIEENKEKINASLLFIYLYLSTITLPLKEITNSGLPVWILTVLVLCISLYNNQTNVNVKVIVITLSISLVFLINYLIYPFKKEILNIFLEFIKFGFIPLYLSSTIKNFNTLIKQWYIFAIINLIIWIFYLDSINSRDLNYMTFGRHMTYSFIIFTIFFYKNIRKKTSFILMIISLFLIAFLSNRSSLLICIVILIFFEILSFKKKNLIFTYFKGIIYIALTLILFLNLEGIVIYIRDLLQNYGINSYIINKAVFAIQYGLIESTSGRDAIYETALKMIQNNNYMPNGIGYFQYFTDIVYPHNIFLDILVTFGIFGLIVFGVFVVIGIYKYFKISDPLAKTVIVSLIIYVGIRLNFSGMFWSEEILWTVIGLMLPRFIGGIKNDYN